MDERFKQFQSTPLLSENQREQLIQRVATEPIFRVADDAGAWICPFTLQPIESLNLFSKPWGREMHGDIATYLLSPDCPGRNSSWRPTATLADVERAAGKSSALRAQMAERNAAEKELSFLRERIKTMNQAAESARETQKDLKDARVVQLKMLPGEPVKIDGYDIASYYEPSTELSGDLYQFYKAAPGFTGFAMGDVAGHGVQAAVTMSSALKSFSVRAPGVLSPKEVLCQVNSDIIQDMARGKFVSAIYVILEHATGKLRGARAGHTVPLLVNSLYCSLDKPRSDGTAIGMCATKIMQSRLTEFEAELPPNGVLLLFTDGVSEAMDEKKMEFGDEALEEALLSCSTLPAQKIVEYLVATVKRHIGSCVQADDMTLVVVKRIGASVSPAK